MTEHDTSLISEQILATFPIFSHFRWRPPSFDVDRNVNMIGSVARNFYMPISWFHELNYLRPGEDIFEWADILDSIEVAGSTFSMAYLGAGYGRWIVNAALAARQRGKVLQLAAIEAEPIHASWLGQHLQDNRVTPRECCVFECAVTADGRDIIFTAGHANEWYGQGIVSAPNVPIGNWPAASFVSMPSKTLREVLDFSPSLDLVVSDIQGSEMEVFCGAVDLLNEKVRRLHIGTHGQSIEEALRKVFRAAGWKCLKDFSSGQEQLTPLGQIKFQDGIQTWVNPNWVR